MFEQAPAGVVRLTAAVDEPRHRGMHLAAVCTAVAEQLGVATVIATKPVHARLVNPRTGEQGFARLHISDEVKPTTIAAQGYILRNAGAVEGDDLDIELWDPITQAAPATSITLHRVDSGLSFGDGREQAHNTRQRLTDSALSLTVGHGFSLPLGGGEATFEVTAAEPAAAAVRCTSETEVVIALPDSDHLTGSTNRPVPQRAVFDDIGGLDGPLQQIAELVVWPAKYPELFERLGIRTARGIILHGPPGNGKTLLARSVARLLGASFFAVNGPEVLSKFYGESEQRLRKVFEDAAREQPSVIFLDELDSLAPSRDNVSGDLEVRLVSQLLTLMDGLTDRGQVVVIGATNRPSAIDPALRRPGRFDREVEIGPPDHDGRHAILLVHTREIPLADDVDLMAIAEMTVGYVGADLASLCQEAAMASARRTLDDHRRQAAVGDALPVAAVSVCQADFVEGLRHVQPSAFREQRQVVVGPDWDDLVGLANAKRALTELIDWPMSKSTSLKQLGIDLGGGIMLSGPALSGKTALVAALAKRLSASLIHLPSVDLLSPWVGESERLVRNAFTKARHASPSIVLIDNFEQLAAAGSDLSRRVLAQVSNELAQLRLTTSAFVVVATRDDLAVGDALFSDVVHMDQLTRADVEVVLERRLSAHLSAEVAIDEVASQLDGLPIGQVLRVCHEALVCALWEDPDKLVVEARHVSTALARVARRHHVS
ncbi:AAA family ATPase [Allocatelliglobosispora scoriae]|nr:AAA family ATPase [Allocatelliglobosispora scoriae]